MNLNDQEKKLFSKVWKILAAIVLAGLLYFAANRVINYFENRNIERSKAIIEKYEARVDSLNKINTNLLTEVDYLYKKIDSLNNVKYKIIVNHEKKINTIYNASAINHAKWLDTILTKMDSLQR